MDHPPESIALDHEELRALARWAAACARRVVLVFEVRAATDRRPREAIDGAEAFAQGGPRTARLRALGWAAWAAARQIDDPAARAAARAASLAAGIAYTHPLATPHQTRHIVGPAAYAALARELAEGSDPSVGDREVRWAVEHAPVEAQDVLRRMPPRVSGKSRLDALLHRLDLWLRDGEPERNA